MVATSKHITVCVCTYKRPQLLRRLLEELALQQTGGQFDYSIVVVDNDEHRSADSIVSAFAAVSPISVKYCLEPRQNIAMARNKAVENADGNFVAFIDDDEFPTEHWLLHLLNTLEKYGVSGVLGPVNPHFDTTPPQWLVKGRFHERPVHPTGYSLQWTLCRTGNVLLRKELLAQHRRPFRPECLSGEDQDFFRRMMEEGHVFVWCSEAVVYEVVPPARWKRGFLVRRALFQGIFSLRNYGFQPWRILQSLIATPVYAAALPVMLVLGQASFMNCVFKLSYHVGRLLALVGINPIRERYVTQ
jgi:succinoglycan biosynthesis protein ExoM